MVDELNAGARARRWRRQLAAFSIRQDETVRTLKFPLDFNGTPPFSFESAAALYQITDGVNLGSLTAYLFAVHLGGFRLFFKEADTAAFRSRSQSAESGFVHALAGAVGPGLDRFTPSALFIRLKKEVRARNGKDNAFSYQVIAREYARDLYGKPLDEKTPAHVSAFFEGIALALRTRFSGWNDVKTSFPEACRVLDEHFAQRGFDLPSLYAMASAVGEVLPKKSTLAFDPQSPVVTALPGDDIAPYVVVALRLQDARAEGLEKAGDLRKRVQSLVTSDTHAGLSWLFGAGLAYLQTTDAAQIAADLAVPKGARSRLETLINSARAIPSNPLHGGTSYAAFRRSVGGRIDSWIANYLSRLDELESMFGGEETPCLPEALFSAEARAFFSGTGLSGTELRSLLQDDLPRIKAAATDSLASLLGKTSELPTPEDIARVEAYAESVRVLRGALMMLSNRITQELDHPRSVEWRRLAEQCRLSLPPQLKDIPALNRFSGGVPDFRAEVAAAVSDFKGVHAEMHDTIESIRTYLVSRGERLDPVSVIQQSEAQHLKGARSPSHRDELDPRRRARLAVLHRFGSVARSCGPETIRKTAQLYERLGAFSNTKDNNRYFINRQGTLYRSAFSTSRHQCYVPNWDRLADCELIDELEAFVAKLRDDCFADGALAATTDFLRIERAWHGILLSGLDASLPTDLVRPRSPIVLSAVPTLLSLRLRESEITPESVQKLFNLYQSVLNGLNVLIRRTEFMVRVRFHRAGDTSLIYAPKQGVSWQVPTRLWSSQGPVRQFLEKSTLISPDNPNIDPVASLAPYLKQKPTLSRPLGAYLMQAPHDWYYPLGTPKGDVSVMGMAIGKGAIESKLRSFDAAARLVGPPSYKNQLDRFLTAFDQVDGGDIMLIVDNRFRQRVVMPQQGEALVEIEDLGFVASVAIPINEKPTAKLTELPFAQRYVSIDQGERGLAFAVFDALTHECMDSGTVRIPSIHNLIRAAKRYRKSAQPNQKFQQRFDSTMFVMRENVVGDVCHEICNLMRKYAAFPVLESSVANLESGSKQLDLVYKAVNARFVFSQVSAHSSDRKSYWQGASYWQHPFLRQAEFNEEGQKTGKSKPLNLFPGIDVHPAGTSQTCSCCKRNPIADLRHCVAKGQKVFEAKNGRVQLGEGSILLYALPEDEQELKGYRRRNERAPMNRPIKDQALDETRLLSILKRNLRQAPQSRQTRDTSQSRYHCVYEDCAKAMHADENAAINIGRKFRKDRLV